MIDTPEDPLVSGFEFRYRVVEVIGVSPEIEMPDGHVLAEHVYEGVDSREFRTVDGAEKYADKLQHRGRGGWPTVIQTGKLNWLTAAGVEAECARVDGLSDAGQDDDAVQLAERNYADKVVESAARVRGVLHLLQHSLAEAIERGDNSGAGLFEIVATAVGVLEEAATDLPGEAVE